MSAEETTEPDATGIVTEPDAVGGEGKVPKTICREGSSLGDGIAAEIEWDAELKARWEFCSLAGDIYLGLAARGDEAATGVFELTGDTVTLVAMQAE